MNAAQRKAIGKQLADLEKSLEGKMALKLEPNADEDERADEDEQPLNEMNQAIASSRNRSDAVLLKKVRAALQRLKDDPDDFGNCTDCGDEIVAGRMKAMPWADLCVDCQSKKDKRAAATPTRRNLTDFSEGEE
ncbi:MAG: TraR/DksA C4-type zinc finger protein [Myxococcaceae bacterium]|nr:TraR/DksA C4-type zinc finger protein [Myxococcaceae bacterium]